MAAFPAFIRTGKQSGAGVVAAAFTDIPAMFDTELKKETNIPKEWRNSQDAAFVEVFGNQWNEWSATGEPYYDTFPFWLISAFGPSIDTLTGTGVYNHQFKPANLPSLLSLQWFQNEQAFQSLDARLDELDLDWAGDGTELTYKLKGFALPETTISTPTPTFSTVRPFKNWMGTVTLGGTAYARLVSASITWKRTVKPFWTFGNGTSPQRFIPTERIATFKGVLDFNSMADYNAAIAGTSQALIVTFADLATTIGATFHPQMLIHMPDVRYSSHKPDLSKDTPLLAVEASTLVYNATDAAAFWIEVQNTVAAY